MKNKLIQILFVHGGMTFKNQKDYLKFLKTRKLSIDEYTKWNGKYLKEQLDDCCQIIKPRMPLKDNAKYDEWKIHFERLLELLDKKIILIGESLGGIFLSKYLSENKLNKKIISIYMICPPFDNSLKGEDLVGGFELQNNLDLIMENCKNITLFFSKDDDVVPVDHAYKYKESLPNANFVIYDSKNGHFNIEEFPEIVEMIKEDTKQILS